MMKAIQASVSHDMRAPIQSITMISSKLINNLSNANDLKLLTAINTASEMMSFLMADLLDF
jgi:K+-sensing histidine kinase KdpD